MKKHDGSHIEHHAHTKLRDLIQSGQSPEARAQHVITYSAQEQATKVTIFHPGYTCPAKRKERKTQNSGRKETGEDKDTRKGVPGTQGEGTVGGRDSDKYISSLVCFSVERKNTHTLSSLMRGLVCALL